MSDIAQILGQFLDGTLVRKHGVVLVLLEILFEETRLATLSSCAEHISELLRHLPDSAVVVHLLLDPLHLFSDEV